MTGDHTTPIKLGDHTFEPVPFTVTTYSAVATKLGLEEALPGREKVIEIKDKVERFNEVSACEGALGRFPGSEVFSVLKNFKKVVGSLI